MDMSEQVRDLANKFLTPYREHNRQLIARLCPFCKGGAHGDENTFAVGLYNGAYNCMRGSCGVSGSFRELCEFFGQKAPESTGTPLPFSQKHKRYELPDETILHPLTEECEAYLARRGISRATMDAFHVSSDENGNIIFPFYRDNKLTFVKFREPRKHTKESKTPKEWAVKDTEPILFGMDNVSFNKPLIITEGEIDALSVYEAGCSNVVSVPSGCSNLQFVDLCWDWLEKFQQIVLFGDNDDPGIQMITSLMNRLGEDRCMMPPEYPPCVYNGKDMGRPCKDANDILLCYGKEELKNLIDQCEPAPVNGVLNLADVAFVDPTRIPRIYTRIPGLDQSIGGLAEGGLTIMTGKRGEGKSTVNGQILLNAIQQGHKVCAYSGELSAPKFLEWILLQATERRLIGVKTDANTGKNFACVSPEIQKRIREWINGNFYLFDNGYTSEKMTQQEAILNVFRICARRYGCKLFLVDNLLVALNCSAEHENKAQADFAAALKTFAVKFKAHVINNVVTFSSNADDKPGELLNNRCLVRG